MSEYTAADAHAAAARGAAWMDEKCPTWFQEIDLRTLDLSDPVYCVLGQTATCLVGPADDEGLDYSDPYFRVLKHFGKTSLAPWTRRRGFYKPDADITWEMLTIAWREIIRERLGVPA